MSSRCPKKLSFELIKLITNDFSEELGHGAFGQVFKGVLEDGEEVAVKMLRFMPDISEQQFENEFEILKRLNDPSIVKLLGFCHEEEKELAEYKGKLIVCVRIHRALCLEYMRNGSLGNLLSGEDFEMGWVRRYKIIKRICEGIEYLQEGLEFPIFHLDLKPDNILLDGYTMAHISDFGLSRVIGEKNSKETLTRAGTIGYIPPEFIDDQVISEKYDIYSLGVIITKIVTCGITAYSNVHDMATEEFVEHVYDKWKKYLQERSALSIIEDEEDCKQVKRCTEIAITCMEKDRHKRPTITDIVSQLPEETVFFRMFDPSSRLPRRKPVWSKKQLSTNDMHKDPPSEIWHHAHPEHKLKLMTATGVAPFLCDGCKEPGYGPRYTCNCGGGGGQSLDLHTRCALAGDPVFDLHTLVHPLFGYGKHFELRFLLEAPSSSSVQEEGRTRVCDACGEATRGFVYHCSDQGLDLHPCCASLPDRFLYQGRAFDLHRRASRPCALCPENEGHRRWFWAYRCHVDGDAVDLHVACLKQTARRCWEACYRNQDVNVGDGGLNVDSMLENMFSSTFGEIAGTLASFITALVFGRLIVGLSKAARF